MPINGKVTGKQAIKASLAAMPEIVREATGEAIRVTASEMVRNAKARVRVDTGTLRDHIDFSFSPTYASAKVGITPGTVVIAETGRASFKKSTRTDDAVFRGQGVRVYRASHYAHMVEFGTIRTHAKPFMGPAFAAQQQPLDSRMRAAQRASLDDLANIGARYL